MSHNMEGLEAFRLTPCPECGLQQYVGTIAAKCLSCDSPLNFEETEYERLERRVERGEDVP